MDRVKHGHIFADPAHYFDIQEDTFSRSENYNELADYLRALIPVTGEGWSRSMCLITMPGGEIQEHAHSGWVAIYYLRLDGTHLEVEGVPILLDNGDTLVIPPGIKHRVPLHKGKHPRMSYHIMVMEEAMTDERPDDVYNWYEEGHYMRMEHGSDE